MKASEVKIPKERIGVIIGKDGKVKSEIEKRTGTKLFVNSETGLVRIVLKESSDPSKILVARSIAEAIGRGFSPEHAYYLLNENYVLDILELDLSGKLSKNSLTRIKGRIIGEKGKTRRIIEESTDTFVSIYGKTAAIIGEYEAVRFAREAILMLINGAPHSAVYSFLRRARSELKRKKIDFYI